MSENGGTEEQQYFWRKGNSKKEFDFGEQEGTKPFISGEQRNIYPRETSEIDYIYHISRSLFSETKSENQEINLVWS